MNPEAVVVAADSALTVGDQKVWDHGNKLFSMGPDHALGIMYFNVADVLAVPVEALIKQFRREYGVNRFDRAEDFHNSLIDFIDRFQNNTFEDNLIAILRITLNFLEQIDFEFDEDDGDIILSAQNLETVIKELPDRTLDVPEEFASEIASLPKAFNKQIIQHIEENNDVLVEEDIDFRPFLIEVLKTGVVSGDHTGIVTFGFGDDEFFPSANTSIIDGVFKGFVRVIPTPASNLDPEQGLMARLMSFAQSDMTTLFMNGASKEYQSAIADELSSEVDDADVVDRIMSNLSAKAENLSARPIMESIRSLPKEEMAIIAESLVDLTGLRRKMDSDVRSVGGPVDVACISKGDGFVWLKRKHYFDGSLNPDFFRRKERGNS